MIPAAIAALMTALLGWLAPAPDTDHLARSFSIDSAGEVVVWIRAGCAHCDWGAAGNEAAVLRLSVDGAYSQHLYLARGAAPAEYVVRLGRFAPGRHELRAERDIELSAKGAGPATIDIASFESCGGRQRRLHRAIHGADRLRPPEHRRQVHRSAAADVVRNRADAAREPVSLFRDFLERRRRHADRSPDGDLGPHHRHRVRLRRRSEQGRRDPGRRVPRAGA